MGIADRLLHPFAAAEGRRAAASEREVRAAASEREIAAHTAALAREIEVYALLVARSERVPARDAAVPASAPRASRALKATRRDHAEFVAASEGLDAARDAVR